MSSNSLGVMRMPVLNRKYLGFLSCLSITFLSGCDSPTRQEDVDPTGAKLALQVQAAAVGTNYYPLSKLYRGYAGFKGKRNYRMYAKPSEQQDYSSEGVAWYILDQNETRLGANPIYELYGNSEHMTSKTTNEGGYQLSGYLGRTFNGPGLSINSVAISPDPLKPIKRYLMKWSTGVWPNQQYWLDHLTGFDGENPSGYQYDAALGYGFPRKNWDMQLNPPVDASITDGTLEAGFIKTWGGVLGKIRHGGIEYINRYNAGREFQIAANGIAYEEFYNPTEGGDTNSNGSPLIHHQFPSAKRFASRTMPLMFRHPGTRKAPDPAHPLLYGGVIFKDVEILSDVNGVKVIRFDAGFTPNEDLNWGTIHIAMYLNYKDLMNNSVSTRGWHKTYTRTSSTGNFTENSSRALDGSGAGWRIVQNNIPVGRYVLGVASGNGTGKAIGLLAQQTGFVTSFVSSDERDINAPGDLGPTSSWCHNIYLMYHNVNLSKGSTFWQRQYILIGTSNQIVSAATAFPY